MANEKRIPGTKIEVTVVEPHVLKDLPLIAFWSSKEAQECYEAEVCGFPSQRQAIVRDDPEEVYMDHNGALIPIKPYNSAKEYLRLVGLSKLTNAERSALDL